MSEAGRCKTCKHWKDWYTIKGERFQSNQPEEECTRITEHDIRPTPRAYLTDPSALLVGPDFGCVLHEEKSDE